MTEMKQCRNCGRDIRLMSSGDWWSHADDGTWYCYPPTWGDGNLDFAQPAMQTFIGPLLEGDKRIIYREEPYSVGPFGNGWRTPSTYQVLINGEWTNVFSGAEFVLNPHREVDGAPDSWAGLTDYRDLEPISMNLEYKVNKGEARRIWRMLLGMPPGQRWQPKRQTRRQRRG